MSLVVTLILFTGCLIFGIKLWKRSRLFSLFLTIPLFLVFLSVGYVVFNSWYHTTPDSLKFSYHKENGLYTITVVWEKPLDTYRFPTDFIVFYVVNNEKIPNVKRKKHEDYKQMDWNGLKESIREEIKKENPPKLSPQIFDVETSKKFSFSFVLPENVSQNDVEIYYVHTREEPMNALEFWIKKIELK